MYGMPSQYGVWNEPCATMNQIGSAMRYSKYSDMMMCIYDGDSDSDSDSDRDGHVLRHCSALLCSAYAYYAAKNVLKATIAICLLYTTI